MAAQGRGCRVFFAACWGWDAPKQAFAKIATPRAKKWDGQYPTISASWRKHWANLIAFFDYPDEIRKVIYTTNAIESLNSVIRKAVERRKLFPDNDSAMKVVYLAIDQAAKKWTMPIHNWKPALNQLMILYGDRLSEVF